MKTDTSEEVTENSNVEDNGSVQIEEPSKPDDTHPPIWETIPKDLWINGSVKSFRKYASQANKEALEKAAQAGNPKAQALSAVGHHLGILSQWDHGLEIREYGKKGCENGMGIACLLVAGHYYTGRGNIVKRNADTAMIYYKKGCEHNYSLACDRIAHRTVIRTNDNQKIEDGFNAIKKACYNGRADSCSGLAWLYLRDDVYLPADINNARKYYERACDLNEEASCSKLLITDSALLETGIGFWRPSKEALKIVNEKYKFNQVFFNYGNNVAPQRDYYTDEPLDSFEMFEHTEKYLEAYNIKIEVGAFDSLKNSLQFKTDRMAEFETIYFSDEIRIKNSKGEYWILSPKFRLIYNSGEFSYDFAIFKG